MHINIQVFERSFIIANCAASLELSTVCGCSSIVASVVKVLHAEAIWLRSVPEEARAGARKVKEQSNCAQIMGDPPAFLRAVTALG